MIAAAMLGALFFAAAGYVGAIVGLWYAERLEALPGGPPAGKPPVGILIAACAIIGAIVTTHGSQAQILLVAVVCVALVAIWITDTTRGVVPDAFTLGPLGLILLLAVWQHDWVVLFSAGVPFVVFATAAILSRGRGMGWGDVKLVALGGALLDVQTGVLAFSLACLAAVVLSYARGHRSGPIAFAPYLAAAIGLAIPLGILR
jgi:prepilin signal peptidase PulO-like enzyme (type II secretory pathway)